VGGAIGAALLPVIAYYWGFALVYAVLALMCLMSAGATWLWLHEYPLTPQPEADHAPTNLPSPLKRWAVWRLALASGLLTVPQIAVLTFAGIYLHDAHHLGMDMLVLLLIIVQLLGGALRILSGRLSDKYRNRRRFIRGFGMLAGLTMIGAALSHSGPSSVVWLLICCSGIFANAWHGVAYTEIAVMAGAHRAGSAIGLEGMAVFSAAFVTPFLMPIILAHTSWPAVWGLIGMVALIAVPLAPGQSANKHKIGSA
ncbi:MAG: MFS transporter, partial [Neisseriaceae bacterium]|nr:MFS transporter [Neisseriaceae bacterium]